MRLLLALWLMALWAPLALAAAPASAVALFYGANPPLDELKAFDVTVVDPDHDGLDPQAFRRAHSELFAYVSVGEVQPSRHYFAALPKDWLRGSNSAWGSTLIDQSAAGWPQFFADQVIAPLWAKGYRGFFLDTLDSYQLFAQSPEEKARQQAGLKALVRQIHQRWPEAKLIFNRGFELLPDLHRDVWMLAAESLYQGYDAKTSSYAPVSEDNRRWLLDQLNTAHRDYQLPVLVIDYVPEDNRELARATAKKIQALGFIPWVSVPALDMLGVGAVEVMPRKVLVVYDPRDWPILQRSAPQRFLAMPLAYLGLVMEYLPVNGPLPDFPLRGRYAGIVSWINDDQAAVNSDYPVWLLRQVRAGVPLAVFNEFGFGPDSHMFEQLGLDFHENPPKDVQIEYQSPQMGFELQLVPRIEAAYPISIAGAGQPWLTFGNGEQHLHSTAIMPWGGFALAPYTVETLPGQVLGERWYMNPLEFLRAALRVDPAVPVPDVTTEMGQRMLMVHVDGDGFMVKAERPGYPFAGQVLLDEVLKRYDLPTTVSVIEGELSPTGLYPKLSGQLEPIARQIFALPNVEIASHTYSHPFDWLQDGTPTGDEGDYHLPIPGYHFDLHREISGSVSYIQKQLAPPGKRVRVLLWSGNCVATPEAVEETIKAGVLNMNGGDTTITRSQNSWTRIAGIGMPKGPYYQVFAPNQNENVYTNLWTGPFYGYEKVIETFEMTENPYRFKPVDIYYHLYAVSKTASLGALKKVYQWALKQPLHPVRVSDYILKVMDFNQFAVARQLDGAYRLRGDGALRTVRLPEKGPGVDLLASSNVAGVAPGPHARYVQLGAAEAQLVLRQGAPAEPQVVSSNADLTHFERDRDGLFFGLRSVQPIQLGLADSGLCRLYDRGRPVEPSSEEGGVRMYELAGGQAELRLDCEREDPTRQAGR